MPTLPMLYSQNYRTQRIKMQTIDTKLHQYVWENLSTISSLLSEKVYQTLENHKTKNNEEAFTETLELILDMDNTLKEKIKSLYENIDENVLEKVEHITKLHITNFKLLKDFQIKFTENINIIIGENSSGKTSLLQALTLGLLEQNYIGGFNDYEKYITKTKNEARINISFGKYEKEVKILENKREIDKEFTPFVLAYGSNIFTKYKLDVEDIVTKLLAGNIKRNFTDSIFEDYVDRFHNPKLILNHLARIDNKQSQRIEKTLRDTINYFIDDFKLEKDEDNRYSFRYKQGNIFRLSNLSEGFRNSILLISDIVIRLLGTGRNLESNAVVLIDEFDRHLHPKWQNNLISKLEKKFLNIQFILSTHNPMSILDREAEEINVLKEVDGVIVAVQGKGTKNIDVSIILLEYFNVKSTIGESMQKKINDFNRFKLQKTLTSKELEELKKLEKYLSKTIASNFIYDKKYLRFLEYIKEHKEIDFNKYVELDEERMKELLEDFGDFFDD